MWKPLAHEMFFHELLVLLVFDKRYHNRLICYVIRDIKVEARFLKRCPMELFTAESHFGRFWGGISLKSAALRPILLYHVIRNLACVAVVSVSFKPSGVSARGHWAKRSSYFFCSFLPNALALLPRLA